MHSLIAVVLCLLFSAPALAGSFQTYESPARTTQSASAGAPAPVRVYGLEHHIAPGTGPFVGLDWNVRVHAPGHSACEVEFWFLDAFGNTVQQTAQSARLDSGGFAKAAGSVQASRANAHAVRELSAKASCI